MMIKKYLIVLTGQGDTFVRLVPPAAKDWIESPYPGAGEGGNEAIPDAVKEGHEDEYDEEDGDVFVSSGSGDNDRAMAIQGIEFDSITEAHKYTKKHKIDIVGDFNGYIY